MNILNVNDSIDPVMGGGTAERTMQISRALNFLDINCTVLTSNQGVDDKYISALSGINIVTCKSLLKRYFIPLVSYKKIKIEVSQTDIVHIMGHWSLLNMLVYIAAISLKKPYIVCPAGALPIFGRSRIIKKLYNWLIGKKIIQNADGWVAITEDEKSQFMSYGISKDRITIIPNGINPDDFSEGDKEEFRKKYNIGDNPFILFLGRLNLIKGPDLLLAAFSRGQKEWQQWHLVFAGPDGGLLNSLKKTVYDNELCERVHFIGYVGDDEKSAAYKSADCMIIPSRQEAMSIVVLEAGITSTPVVLTDKCGFNQIEEIDGGKVCSASVDGIYSALKEVMMGNNNLEVLGKNLENFVCKNYTWKAVIPKYIELYHQLLEKRKISK